MSRRTPRLHVTHRCPPEGPRTIGVTVATPDYMPLAVEAARRWKLHSGFECLILTSEPGRCWWAKYDLAELLGPVRVCFFDADVWAVAAMPVAELWPAAGNVELQAVPDPGVKDELAFPYKDCRIFDLPPAKYFNTGFWTADLANPRVRAWLKCARDLTLDVARGDLQEPVDFGEQTLLNLAAHRLHMKVQLLDHGWSWMQTATSTGQIIRPAKVYAIHAAGVRSHQKFSRLTSLAAALEPLKAP